MKFAGVAILLALTVATQATPLLDVPGIEIHKTNIIVPRDIEITRDVEKPTPAQSTPVQSTPVQSTPAQSTPAKTTTAESTATPTETGTVVAPNNWITAMACRINVIRTARGLHPLGLSAELNTISQRHSEYQNSIKQMTHSDPGGGLGDRLSAMNIPWSSAAENVAAGMQTPEQAQQALENSSGHLANMLSPNMAYFGAGAVNGYYTQMFYGVSGNARATNIPKCN
ncbi:hypothetical protein GGF42_003140 [Coemansia sp. RSA 2424]|nr:hypothetical protein GGF42_003140 [Coemansia sp. RSA 2424]